MSQLTRIVVTDGDVEDMVASGMVAAEIESVVPLAYSIVACVRKSFPTASVLCVYIHQYEEPSHNMRSPANSMRNPAII